MSGAGTGEMSQRLKVGAALTEDPRLVPRTHTAAYKPLQLLGNPSWLLQSFQRCLNSQGHSYKRLGIKPPLVLSSTATQVGPGKSPEALSTLTHKGAVSRAHMNQPQKADPPF